MMRNRRGMGKIALAGIVQRMLELPQSIIGGVSRTMGHGIKLMAIGSKRRHRRHLPPPEHPLTIHATADEKYVFLDSFERQYGSLHPFFYACSLEEVLRMCVLEGKSAFVYLHSPDHPFTAEFCRETLCLEVVVSFLDANFICWAGIPMTGEGQQVAASLRPASFPFCAIVSPACGDSFSVLQQIEGPVSPAQLVETLQGTLEEQSQPVFMFSRDEDEERIRRESRLTLRKEQDSAYLTALKIDIEKERPKDLASPNNKPQAKKDPTRHTLKKSPKDTQILIRFPNGERREQAFSSMDEIMRIYEYVDSLGLSDVGNYRLISSFPKRVFGMEQIGLTLRDAGLFPRATLFIEQLHRSSSSIAIQQ